MIEMKMEKIGHVWTRKTTTVMFVEATFIKLITELHEVNVPQIITADTL